MGEGLSEALKTAHRLFGWGVTARACLEPNPPRLATGVSIVGNTNRGE